MNIVKPSFSEWHCRLTHYLGLGLGAVAITPLQDQSTHRCMRNRL
jgi:hypothetical protein